MRVCCGIIAVLALLVDLKAVAAQGEFLTSASLGASRAALGSAAHTLKPAHNLELRLKVRFRQLQQLFTLISAPKEPRRNFFQT